MSRVPISILVLSVLVAQGCNRKSALPETPPPPAIDLRVDADSAFGMLVEQVEIGPRHSGSPGARTTAEYIAGKAAEFGYEATIDTWDEVTTAGKVTFHNVYAELPGPRPGFLLLGSHFDTKYLPGMAFQGANDAASSTALLLEIMRVLRGIDGWQGRTLRFAFFDGEEARRKYGEKDGLHGSKRLAARFQREGLVEQCRAMLLLDMVGDKDLSITMPRDSDSQLARDVLRAAEAQGVREHFGFFLRGSILDDHVPFQQLGIPAVNLIDFTYGPSNSYWHNESDSLDNVAPRSLEIVGNVVLHLIQQW